MKRESLHCKYQIPPAGRQEIVNFTKPFPINSRSSFSKLSKLSHKPILVLYLYTAKFRKKKKALAFAKYVSIFILAIFSTCFMVESGDPDLILDFIAPPNTSIDGSFFTFQGLRSVFDGKFPPNFKPTKASLAEFPALLGQSVSLAVLQFPASAINPPHLHPRSTELLFVVDGSLQVGFVDTTNKLFNQTLQVGDIFLFPKGLVHFQFNADPQNSATAIAAFGSVNPGTVSIPLSVFTTGISDDILAKAFKTNVIVIEAIKVGLAQPN